MKTIYFKCTLKTDIILNMKSATEGNNETLDFIPGSNFLGIVAAKYDEFEKNGYAWEIFHSGKVRFGDAHPSKDGKRSLRVPASMFYPKMKKISDVCYIHHFYDRDKDREDNGGPQQLKQCRNGFYVFADNEAIPVQVEKTFAIKSAYDRNSRRSKDEAMYGYESIDKGTEFIFSVEMDNDGLEETIKNAISGEKHIGRSRTAQYGLVKIEECNFGESESKSKSKKSEFITVYTDSRLIFLDKNGNPTFRPSIDQLGLESGDICWEKSQIRTFQYSPWNFKRQCYDTDRCGIEKGSVFVINNCDDSSFSSKYIGSYNNEGFGKVIYNPDFLESKEGTNGEAVYIIQETKDEKPKYTGELKGNPLLDYLAACKKEEETTLTIYKMVNDFVDKHSSKFQNEKFASQWGTIRSIAFSNKKNKDNDNDNKDKDKDNKTICNEIIEYISHGVKSSDWEGARRNEIENFMNDNLSNIRLAIINLAAEMAKKCRKENKQDE